MDWPTLEWIDWLIIAIMASNGLLLALFWLVLRDRRR